MSEIHMIHVEPKEDRTAVLLRLPEHLKDFLDYKAEELGYNTTEYCIKVFTAIMENE